MQNKFSFPEGATPVQDISDLIPTWVNNLRDLNRVEAENILKAQRKYLARPTRHPMNWFSIKMLRALHREMFGNVWKWAGQYRKSVTSIGIEPKWIPVQLAEFCSEVQGWFEYPVELTFLERAARIHHRLVFIHPFENGNGRFSRLVADRFLLAFRCSYPLWPIEINNESSLRKAYIHTLKEADRGDYLPLIEFMKKFGAKDQKPYEILKNIFFRNHINENSQLALMKAYFRCGSSLYEKTSEDENALHLAAKYGKKEIAKYLIDVGIEIDAKDRRGITPLEIAKKKGNKALIQLLLQRSKEKKLNL